MDSLWSFPTHQHPADWLALGCNPGSDRTGGSASNFYIIASFSKTSPIAICLRSLQFRPHSGHSAVTFYHYSVITHASKNRLPRRSIPPRVSGFWTNWMWFRGSGAPHFLALWRIGGARLASAEDCHLTTQHGLDVTENTRQSGNLHKCCYKFSLWKGILCSHLEHSSQPLALSFDGMFIWFLVSYQFHLES